MLGRLQAWVDGALDGAVAGFALWTLAFQVALAGEHSLRTVVVGWLPVAIALVVLGARSEERLHGSVLARPAADGDATWRAPAVAAACGLVVVGALAGTIGVLPAVALALVVLGAGLVRVRLHAEPLSPESVPPRSEAGRGLPAALGLGLVVAVLAACLRRGDADDTFYLNRATWVAEHGVAATRDTMFGPQTFPTTYGDGLDFPSVEGLYGALANLLDLRTGDLVYLGLTPVLAFLVVLATWRLVCAWVPRRQVAVLVVAVLAMVLGAATIVGAYSFARIWQGKVIAFAVLMPIVWVHLTRLLDPDRRVVRRSQVVLLLAGIAFAGLTSAAPMLTPSTAGAAVLGAVVLRSRALAVGAALFAVGPIAAGLSVVVGGGGTGAAADVDPIPVDGAFVIVFGGTGALIVVGLLAATVAPWALRPVGSVLAGAAALASFVALVPGVPELVDAATGAGNIAWRLATVVPIAVLIGVLVAVVVPDLVPSRATASRGAVRGAAGVAGVAVLAAVGTPLWQDTGLGEPVWKVPLGALDDVEAVLEVPARPGSMLLPQDESHVLVILTTRRFATIPRVEAVAGLADEPDRIAARYELYRWLNEDVDLPARKVVDGLDLLDVAVVCVDADDTGLRDQLDRVAGGTAAPVTDVGDLACAARAGATWSTPSPA